jgi:hypothetical protein
MLTRWLHLIGREERQQAVTGGVRWPSIEPAQYDRQHIFRSFVDLVANPGVDEICDSRRTTRFLSKARATVLLQASASSCARPPSAWSG